MSDTQKHTIAQAEIKINEVSSGIRYPASCVHATEYNVFIHSMNTRNWISDSRTYFMWRKTEMSMINSKIILYCILSVF